MKNKRTRILSIFRLGSPYGVIPLFRLRHLTTDGGYRVCVQLLIQSYTDQLETLQALLSWSVDVHIFLTLLSISFLSFFFFFFDF